MKFKKPKVILAIILSSISLLGCRDKLVEELVEKFDESVEAEGGLQGVADNAKEMFDTTGESYVVDPDTGTVVLDENETANTETIMEDDRIGLNETNTFDTQNGGIINVTFTECGSKNDTTYITYVIENIGDTDVTVGESMFSVYANDYKVDLNYGDNTVYEEIISSGRKVSGQLYPNVILDSVTKLEIECGDVTFLLRDTANSDAMLGTYYRIGEKNGYAIVDEINLYREQSNNNGLAISARHHIDYGNGEAYNYDFGSWVSELFDDRIAFTSSLHSIRGLEVYFSSNPAVDGIYIKQMDTQSEEDMFTGNYMWTNDIQSVYDSINSSGNDAE